MKTIDFENQDEAMDMKNIWSGYSIDHEKQNTRCLSVNTILAGKYLVGPVLGQGGFGITYMGYDLNMDTRIAIKEYFPVELVSRDTTTMHGDRVLSLSGEKSVTYQQGLKKYVAEAQSVSQFSEVPGVVSVKDFFYENETAYIVMEYIEGISLKDYLKEKGGRLPEEETLSIMKPVLEALVRVHAAGIIHRDISPDNIMLTFEENQIKSVKLIDFGAARMTAKNDQKSLTIILKHGYAPEEQYRTHGEQGPWTDVYAVCAVMYRMLTGETPVPAMDRMFKDELKSFEEHGFEVKAALNQGNADKKAIVSQNTAAAILKGLAVKKDDRMQSMRDLIAALYDGIPVNSSKRNTAARKRLYMIAGICGIAVVVTGVLTAAFGMVWSRNQTEWNESVVMENASDTIEKTAVDESTTDSTEASSVMHSDSRETELSFAKQNDLGEVIAYWNPQTSICGGGGDHVLICKQDGTVQAIGSNGFGQCMVDDWMDIVGVSSSERHSLGLRKDGKVFAVGDNSSGQCDVDIWTNIVQVAAGSNSSYGLTLDGKVLGTGYNSNGVMETISEWENIKTITTDYNVVIGLDYDGNLHYAGNSDELQSVSGWQDVNYMISAYPCVMGLKEDGTCVLAELGECDWSLPDWENYNNLQQIQGFSQSFGVTRDGKVLLYDSFEYTGIEQKYDVMSNWSGMDAVINAGSADRTYVIGLKKDGSVIEFEQCYGNSSPEEMENLEWIDTMEVNGYTNLVAKTRDGKLLTYGLEYFRMDDYAAMNDKDTIHTADIAGLVGMDTWLMDDGRLFYNGYFSDGFQDSYISENVKQALDIGPMLAGLYAVLTEDGRVKFQVIVDDNSLTSVYLEWVKSAEEWTDVVQITGTDHVLFGLHKDGSISVTDGNVAAEGFIKIQCNEYANHATKELVGIREDGTADVIIATESSVAYGRTQITTWDSLTDICLGESHVVGLRDDGTVVAAGSNHSGQCDVEDWHDIVYLKAGKNCTLGIDKDGKLWMVGSLY